MVPRRQGARLPATDHISIFGNPSKSTSFARWGLFLAGLMGNRSRSHQHSVRKKELPSFLKTHHGHYQGTHNSSERGDLRESGPRHPCHLWNVNHKLNDFLRSRGIASAVHSLRHWFTTSTDRVSKDVTLVGEMLGHASPTITLAIYAHTLPGWSGAWWRLAALR